MSTTSLKIFVLTKAESSPGTDAEAEANVLISVRLPVMGSEPGPDYSCIIL